MTKKQLEAKIEALEREVEALKQQILFLNVRPAFVPVPCPHPDTVPVPVLWYPTPPQYPIITCGKGKGNAVLS